MIKRLLSFLDASPVNFLAVKNISEELEKNGFRRMNPQEPLGKKRVKSSSLPRTTLPSTPSKSERNLWQMPVFT